MKRNEFARARDTFEVRDEVVVDVEPSRPGARDAAAAGPSR